MSALILVPPALLCLLGLVAAAAGRRPRLVEALGSWGGAAGNLLGLAGVVAALALGEPCTTSLPWLGEVGGSFRVALDPLSGFFLLPVYGIGAASALYGGGYLRRSARRLGSAWLFYHLLVASMALVVLARNAVLFLLAWEAMTISSWTKGSTSRRPTERRCPAAPELILGAAGVCCACWAARAEPAAREGRCAVLQTID